jgi:RNA polymerase sigma-70 factor (ECF subfamily)
VRADAIGPFEVTALRDRDQALDRLARAAARRGYAIARDLLRDAAEAEDAVQESLARACAGWERLRDADALEGWFYRVLTNHCLRTLKRRRIFSWFRRGNDDDGDAPELELPAGGLLPDEALARATETTRCLRAVERLPPMQKAALVLRYGHDLSVDEVADAMGIGPGTVKTHLVRGLRKLREGMSS